MPARQEIISDARLTGTTTVAATGTFTGKPGAVFDFRVATVLLPDGFAIAITDGADLSFVSTLAGLSDVAVSGAHSPADGQALVWDQTLGKWIPGTVATGGGTGDGLANPMTTAGDLIVGASGGTAIRLAKGTAGQVLTVKLDGTLGWVTPATGGGGGGTPALLAGGTVYYSTQNGGYPATNVRDGDVTTHWYSDSGAVGTFVGVDFGAAHQITQFELFPESTLANNLSNAVIEGAATQGGTYTQLGILPASLTTGAYNPVTVTDTGTYQCIRVRGVAGGPLAVKEIRITGI